jgi:hypothetical protein
MPGLGSEGCGESPCGLDTQTPTAPRNVTPPAALAFNGITKDFSLDANGLYESAHPVDSRFFNVMRIAANSIRSAQDVGHTVGSIAYIDKRTVQASVENRVRVAAADMVNAGLVRIRDIELDTSVRGRIAYAVHYVNLVTQRKDTFRST